MGGKARWPWVAAWMAVLGCAHAQEAPDPDVVLRRQQSQIERLRERNEPHPAVRLTVDPAGGGSRLVGETPCRPIQRVHIDDHGLPVDPGVLAGPARDDPPQGRCLGTEGIALLITRLQDALIAQGLVTTRVEAPDQDLSQGELRLVVLPGRVARIHRERAGAQQPWDGPALTMTAGEPLQLRSVEHTLENLRRHPGAQAHVRIEPTEAIGQSDVLVEYEPGPPLGVQLVLDDAGSRSTGQWQASATLRWFDPLGLSDLFYVSSGRDIGGRDPGPRGSESRVLHYSLPWGWWLFGFTHHRGGYRQTVFGPFESYLYRGTSDGSELKASRVVQRSAESKTALSLAAWTRSSRNYINDAEVHVQRRRTGGWQAGVSHTHYVGTATLDLSLDYRQGTGAFASMRAPEEASGEGSSRMRLTKATASVVMPLRWGRQIWRYMGEWRGQANHTPLTPQDLFCVAGRSTVRGFDGERSLCGERGQLVRQELAWSSAFATVAPYVAFDAGEVGGRGVASDRRLVGWGLGLRGQWQQGDVFTDLDLFVGRPIRRPDGFEGTRTVAGFSLAVRF
jgi:hemolysin activation/secretion protein